MSKLSGLSCVGIFWAVLSLLATVAASVGFYMPYWLHGAFSDSTPIYFGVFRRCNYPKLDDGGHLVIVRECGRYTTFWDIPSVFWQIATVSVGVGCGLGLLVSMTGVMSVCVRDVITPVVGKVASAMQLCAGLLIGGGLAIYPYGWDNVEVHQACQGLSGHYNLGSCTLSWAFYLTGCGAGLTIICCMMACHAHRKKDTHAVTYHV
ncbi:LHFPL tetraspan subfamily member 6 protein-like isoform X1 [Haliotis rubra]|uniref:LHFPL tetraspan subfamily member 6 protein-like isoform X1 n=1 Tax=Haliotis rubra TaxID=36100 RepID=UPI001EE53B52|nr:LHFPL tetraspan subfamily member 6 protein-like isoform X1 [Haliotis rubra]